MQIGKIVTDRLRTRAHSMHNNDEPQLHRELADSYHIGRSCIVSITLRYRTATKCNVSHPGSQTEIAHRRPPEMYFRQKEHGSRKCTTMKSSFMPCST